MYLYFLMIAIKTVGVSLCLWTANMIVTNTKVWKWHTTFVISYFIYYNYILNCVEKILQKKSHSERLVNFVRLKIQWLRCNISTEKSSRIFEFSWVFHFPSLYHFSLHRPSLTPCLHLASCLQGYRQCKPVKWWQVYVGGRYQSS